MSFFRIQKTLLRLLKLQNVRYISGTRRNINNSYYFKTGDIPLSSLCIGDIIDKVADTSGDNTAIISVHQNLSKTFWELRQEAEKLASGFIYIGLRKGDRIAIYCPNCYEWILTQFAAAKAGLILVNINPASQKVETEYFLKKVGCKSLVMWDVFKTQDFYKILCDIVPELPNSTPGKFQSSKLPNLESVIMISEDNKSGILNFKDVLDCGNKESDTLLSEIGEALQFDDPVNIQFTSGTTGTPKAAVLTHHNLVNNVIVVGRRLGFHLSKPTTCVQIPMFHSFGCVHGSLNTLFHLGTCVFPAVGFDSISSLKAIEEHKCSIVFGTPTMYVDMIRHYKSGKFDIEHAKNALIGGAASPAVLIKEMRDILGITHITNGYGVTETGPGIALTEYNGDFDKAVNGIMKVLEYVEVKVLDNKGKMVPTNVQGEICVRGHNIFWGYWDDEKKTEEVLDKTNWYHTGDIGTIDEEGFMQVSGRIKEMIIRGGENIYPQEVENFLNTHPAIMDVYICGVPDKRMGEEACAWICVKDGMKLTEEEIRSFCTGKISHFKIPRYILFVKEFPKTQTGKVKKFEMTKTSIEKLKL